MGTREFTESEVGYWTGELIESEVTDQMRLWGSYFTCRFHHVVLYTSPSTTWNGTTSEI